MPPSRDSIPLLRFRSWIALGVVVGFYVLSITISAGLLFVAYEAVMHMNGFSLALASVIGAGTILWSIVPRFERFVPPGPEITPEKEPRLFQQIGQIARQCNQPIPHAVYLTGAMNAGVLQHGGFLGQGSRSILIVGLPLIGATTVSQFRAIIAHEFGHFYGGDTRLAPWIYRTTKSIVRTLTLLARRKSYLTFLFEWYGAFFLRTTRSISRHQEFAADALGARLAGAKAMQESLQATISLGVLSQLYWQSEVQPVLKSGFRPSLASGFQQFVSAEWCRELATKPEADSTTQDVYDTHPPLRERIAALQGLPQNDAPDCSQAAITLFDHLDEQEARLIAFLQKSQSQSRSQLIPIAWEDVGKRIYVPEWIQKVQKHADALAGITPAALANMQNLAGFWEKIRDSAGTSLTREQRQRWGLGILGTGLALALYQQGWELHAVPGKLELQHDGITIAPFRTVFKLASREISPEDWLEQCKQAGILQMDLSQVPASGMAARQ